MKPNANKGNERQAVLMAAALAILLLGTGTIASAGQEAEVRIRSIIEQSSLSAGDKAGLLDASNRALGAGVPAEDVEIIITRGRERRIDARTTGELIDTATKAREQGLPVRPVLNRIEQGLSKGVPAERISAASRKLAEKMGEAQPIVDGLVKGGVRAGSGRDREYAVEAVARALEKSISRDAILDTGSRVRENKGSVGLFDKAVRTMTNLTDSGMSTETAQRMVNEAVKKGYTERDLGRLEREVAEEVRKGRGGDAAGKAKESEIRSGRDREPGNGKDMNKDSGRDSGREKNMDRDRVRDHDRERERLRDKEREREGGRSGKD